jgi:hypothetical protein
MLSPSSLTRALRAGGQASSPTGLWSAGSGVGAVDISGHHPRLSHVLTLRHTRQCSGARALDRLRPIELNEQPTSVRLALQYPAKPIRCTGLRPVIPTRDNGRRAYKPDYIFSGRYPQRIPSPAVRLGTLKDPPEEELQLSVARSTFFSLRPEQNRIVVEEERSRLGRPARGAERSAR